MRTLQCNFTANRTLASARRETTTEAWHFSNTHTVRMSMTVIGRARSLSRSWQSPFHRQTVDDIRADTDVQSLANQLSNLFSHLIINNAVEICSISGNLLVILVIICHRKMRNDVNFFLSNLAVADLCVGVFCIVPNLSLYISQQRWLIGRVSQRLR